MRIDSSGNVGIGTTSPVEILTVEGSITTAENQFLGFNGYYDGGWKSYETGSVAILKHDEANNSFQIRQGSSSETKDVAFTPTIPFCVRSGNVGIGTDNPPEELFVQGYLGLSNLSTVKYFRNWPEIGGNSTDANNARLHWQTVYSGGSQNLGYLQGNVNGSQLNFTGQHKNLMNQNIDTTEVGLIVSATNNNINLDNSIIPKINESLPYCVLANTDNDKKVFGVISDKEDINNSREYSSGNFVSVYEKTNTNEQRIFINSVGEGAIWVCNKNGTLDNGDYITSTTVTGYGGKQTDDILHNYTVAKITSDCDFSLTKIVKQKLKVITSTDSDGNTTNSIDYDANGDLQFEDDLDENGNQQMVYPLETRFLQADGTLLIDEADYNTRLGNGESVYIACFVGCTYHCG